jgi:pimeloyl-ACP methyl ester carboxylesterase
MNGLQPSMYQPRRESLDEHASVRGLDIHTTRWPGSDPRPWLLLHGWMDAGATFQFLADALPDERSLIAPDWRGFGSSAWPSDGYWFPDYYADLDALCAQLSPGEPVTLIGHSMGANVAMMYAGIRPERVRAVVSVEGFGLPRTRPEQAPERFRTWLSELEGSPSFARFPSYDAFAQYLQRRNPRLPADRADYVARAWARESPDGGIQMRGDPRHKRVNPILYRREEAEACWREMRAPLLFVVAAESEQARRFVLEEMRALMPGLEVVTIANAGHMVHHERPDGLAAAIEKFMSSLDRNVSPRR